MATLSGNKVKDTYSSLLKLSSNSVTTTLKDVEDGSGTTSALKISTTNVGVDGVLSFVRQPTASTTELTALLIDASGNVVSRELGAGAFGDGSGGVSTLSDLTDTTITSPSSGEFLKYNGEAWVNDTVPAGVSTLNALTDTTITTPSNGDLLFYNGSAWVNDSTPRTVAFVDSSNAVNFATPNSNGNILFEAGSNMAITYSGNTVSFASTVASTGAPEESIVGATLSAISLSAGGSAKLIFSPINNATDGSSFHFGSSKGNLALDAITPGEFIENISGSDIVVHVSITAFLEATQNGRDINYSLEKWNGASWATIKSVHNNFGDAASYADSFWGIFMLAPSQRLRIGVSSTTGGISVSQTSLVSFTVKEI